MINNYIKDINNVVIFKNTISPSELNDYNKESINFNFFSKKIKKNTKIYQDTNGNIVYQDEYEYYGNIGKQQFFKERLKQRTYYNINKKPEYHEVFDYATPNEIYVNEKSTSTIYDNTKKQIGYRYYANTHDNIKHNTFFTVLENKQNNKYDILEKDSNPYYTNINNEDITQEKNIIQENENNKEIAIQEVITQKKQIDYIGIINKIIVDKLNERDGYQIGGNIKEIIGFITALSNSENSRGITITNPIMEKGINFQYSVENNFRDNTGINIMPITLNSHITSLFINRSTDNNLEALSFDSSLYHYIKYKTDTLALDNSVFGTLSNQIEILNNSNIQINGTCSYWQFYLITTINNKKINEFTFKYNTIDDLKINNINGDLYLDIICEMEKKFDQNTKSLIKTMSGDVTDDIEYVNIANMEIDNKYVKIALNKNAYKNKFLNLETIYKLFNYKDVEVYYHKDNLPYFIQRQKEYQNIQNNLKLLYNNKVNLENQIAEIQMQNKTIINNSQLLFMYNPNEVITNNLSIVKSLFDKLKKLNDDYTQTYDEIIKNNNFKLNPQNENTLKILTNNIATCINDIETNKNILIRDYQDVLNNKENNIFVKINNNEIDNFKKANHVNHKKQLVILESKDY